MRHAHPLRLKIALGLMMALVGLFAVADFLPHTDDGCAVESHCLACRAHISAVTDLVTFASLPIGPNVTTPVERAPDQSPLDAADSLLPPGRAPPASA